MSIVPTLAQAVVSIHAPVMDAKFANNISEQASDVSIHAPVMDAKPLVVPLVSSDSFNPRARDGREVDNLPTIEALAGFNPRARDGREPKLATSLISAMFQSTRP